MSDPMLRRVRLVVHYDGSAFFGWQVQAQERTVQGEMERVLARLTRRAVRVHGSGRTDRGVHATGQVAAVDVPQRWTPTELRRAMNALLPADVWIAEAHAAAPRFHPRFDAVARSYVYRVGTTEASRSPFLRRTCWALAQAPDLALLERSAAALVGDHSFRAFAKAGQEHRGERCIVTQAGWSAWGSEGVQFQITANRFLHHMVRYLVGTQVEIALGHRDAADLPALLRGEAGRQTSPPAPAEGLFLTAVAYADIELGGPASGGPPPAPPH